MLTHIADKQTALYREHLRLSAQMTSFGGWTMPLKYSGILSEYAETRERVAMFDTSHMGEFLINGALTDGLDRIVTPKIHDMPLKSCRYGLMLNEAGGVKDDLLIYRMDVDQWMLVVNAGTTETDAQHIQAHLSGHVSFCDVSSQTVKLDVQGPRSREILGSFVPGIEKLDYYTFDEFDVLGKNIIISRTGYTGELGFELYGPEKVLLPCWSRLLEMGVQPAGLGVRDILRIEMGYPLYGHEINEDMSLLEAGLGRFVDWDKDFIGKAGLLKLKAETLPQKSAALLSDSRRAPRCGHVIFTEEGEPVGKVTSGTFSPSFKKGVGLALVKTEFGKPGQKILFGSQGQKEKGTIVRRPVYQQGSLKD